MVNTKDILWLAGLLEGEGCFSSFQGTGRPRIQLAMGDKDVIERAAAIMGVNKIAHRILAAPRKPQFGFCVTGKSAAAWMMSVYALMGARRQQRITEVLLRWRITPSRPIGRPRKDVAGV